MRWLARLRPSSIRGQITALVVTPVVIAFLAAAAIELTDTDEDPAWHPEQRRIQIETAARLIGAAETPEEASAIADAILRSGLGVEELSGAAVDAAALGDPDDGLLVRIDDSRALLFPGHLDTHVIPSRITKPAKYIIGSALVLLVLLLVYAVRAITAPLSRFSAAAQTLAPDNGPDRPFEERGSREITALARALNDMRSRIRTMIDDRTRMLRAISHDLRTPLTRLRLRVERSTDPELREGMLSDIRRVSDMIDETLTYLREDVSAETPLRADLPSLLQTVCSDFADIGFAVSYEGPDRLACECKPRALARAVGNLVDNGTKFANEVVVRLRSAEDGAIEIEVADDGPGLPAEVRARAPEPFFKGDAARTPTGRSGFGLGLSIVHDVMRGHGGSMQLLEEEPHGLVVRLRLPAAAARAGLEPGLPSPGFGQAHLKLARPSHPSDARQP